MRQAMISGFINQASATSRCLPPGYYNPNPPQTSLYGPPNLSGVTAAQIAYCNSRRRGERHHLPGDPHRDRLGQHAAAAGVARAMPA